MIHLSAEGITAFLCRRKIVINEESEIYVYGLELLITGLINIISILLVGITTNTIVFAIIYNFMMILIRSYTGGYHAKNSGSCIVLFTSTYIVTLCACELVELHNMELLSLLCVEIGLLIVGYFAPIKNANKRLSIEQSRKYKSISVLLYSIFNIISVLLFQIGNNIIFRFHLGYETVCKRLSIYINMVLIAIVLLIIVERLIRSDMEKIRN